MRFVGLIGLLLLGSCTTASSFPAPDGRQGYAIKCNGGANSMGGCYKKAAELCGVGNYDIIDRSQSSSVVGAGSSIVPARFRDLEIACKVPPKTK